MILTAILGLILLRMFYSAAEVYYERDWPRRTWSGLVLALSLLIVFAIVIA